MMKRRERGRGREREVGIYVCMYVCMYVHCGGHFPHEKRERGLSAQKWTQQFALLFCVGPLLLHSSV